MLLHVLVWQFWVGAVVGFVACAFMPAIGRMIKGWFSKETGLAKDAVKSKL